MIKNKQNVIYNNEFCIATYIFIHKFVFVPFYVHSRNFIRDKKFWKNFLPKNRFFHKKKNFLPKIFGVCINQPVTGFLPVYSQFLSPNLIHLVILWTVFREFQCFKKMLPGSRLVSVEFYWSAFNW